MKILCRRIWFWQRDEFKAAGWIIGHHTLWRKIRPVAVKADACGCGAGAPCPVCMPKGECPDTDRYMAEVLCSVWDDEA